MKTHCRCVENAFGILVVHWQIMLGPMNVLPDTAQLIIQACTVLHNFLQEPNADQKNLMQRLNPNQTNFQLMGLNRFGYYPGQVAKNVQRSFAAYFRSEAGCLGFFIMFIG